MPGTSPSVCLRDETRRGLAPRGKCQMSLISILAAAQLFQAISPAQATCHRLAGGPRARLRGWQQGGGLSPRPAPARLHIPWGWDIRVLLTSPRGWGPAPHTHPHTCQRRPRPAAAQP